MATRKKPSRGKKTDARANGGSVLPPMPAPDMDMIVISDGDGEEPVFDPAENALIIPNEDGTLTIELGSEEVETKDPDFDDNLAEFIDEHELGRISSMLLEAIAQDDSDRSEWLQQRADGLDLLGQKIEKPGGGNVGSSSTAVPGQSTVRDGILGDACERFRANAFAELCPSDGPVKVVNYGKETTDMDGLAQEFEKDLNFYLTSTAREYYPDTNKMLWWTGYASGMFKKVYRCPLRNRPVSVSVDGADLIVPSNATDLHNAGRITHQINMRQSIMKRMQILGEYRNIPLSAPTPQANVLQTKEGNVTGMNPMPQRVEDQDYTVYECYCELDIPGFEHTQKGEPTGLPLPYRVTLDKDSKQILEIRRNWNQPKDNDDPDQLPTAKIPFVLFAYSLGLGFYGTGLLHKLGNYAMAITAMLRECIDAGMFASFPGFLFAKPMGRQLQNEFRVPPGGGAPIDVSATGNDINKAVMPLPYKDVSQAMVALMSQTRDNAARIGGTAEAPTGEGVINAPVGSVLAAIDQATRVEGGVHKMLYAAQKEELELLKELFRDDPEALWRGNKRPAMGPDHAARLARFKLALENCDLIPASDPNVPSHMHRMAKANTLLQTALAMPGAFNMPKTIINWGTQIRIDNIAELLAPPQAQQPDPAAQMGQAMLALKVQEIQLKQQQLAMNAQKADKDRESKETIEAMKMASQHANTETPNTGVDPLKAAELAIKQAQLNQKGAEIALKAREAQANRESKETVEVMKIAQALAVHPTSDPVVDEQLQQLSGFITPAKDNGMAEGGPVEAEPAPEPEVPEKSEAEEAVDLGLRIARSLQAYNQDGPPRWWQ